MLIYLKNADLGRTERKPGAYCVQATQPENPCSETVLSLGSQTHQAKGRTSPRAGCQNSPRSLCVEKRVEGIQEHEPDVSRRNCSLCFCSGCPFSPGLWYENIWKGLGWGRGIAPENQSQPFPRSLRLFLLCQAFLTVSFCMSSFPGGSSFPEANSLLAAPPYQAARLSWISVANNTAGTPARIRFPGRLSCARNFQGCHLVDFSWWTYEREIVISVLQRTKLRFWEIE